MPYIAVAKKAAGQRELHFPNDGRLASRPPPALPCTALRPAAGRTGFAGCAWSLPANFCLPGRQAHIGQWSGSRP